MKACALPEAEAFVSPEFDLLGVRRQRLNRSERKKLLMDQAPLDSSHSADSEPYASPGLSECKRRNTKTWLFVCIWSQIADALTSKQVRVLVRLGLNLVNHDKSMCLGVLCLVGVPQCIWEFPKIGDPHIAP